MRHVVRVSGAGRVLDHGFAGTHRGRAKAILMAIMLVEGTPLIEGQRTEVVEIGKRSFTLIGWEAMQGPGGLEWCLERASGMRGGECERYGIDWRTSLDRGNELRALKGRVAS